MTIDESTERKVYRKLQAFNGLEVAGHEPVNASLASVLKEGEVLGDDGNQYDSIQAAVDASDSWAFVGPGTYYENVVINKDDFMLQGSGNETLIDGGDIGPAITVNSQNNIIQSIICKTGQSSFVTAAIVIKGDSTTLERVTVSGSYEDGIEINANNCRVKSCTIDSVSRHGLFIKDGRRVIMNDCTVKNPSDYGILFRSDDSIVSDNVVINTGGNSIGTVSGGSSTDANDAIIKSNRIINSGNAGIVIASNSTDIIVANNRISDSTNADIDDNGTGTVLDDNLTGSAN